ncbi:MAG TPA: ABC transporter permease [Bryobacteraceae bacterium]|nr:ABC transporter permease [Bryobacteraceae bacterium]
MGLLAILRVAALALTRNKMRSALTMLGIIIGVAAVICSVAVGTGASNQIQQQISNLGDNMIWVEAGGRSVNGVRTGSKGTKTLVLADAKAIEQQIPNVTHISPHVDTAVQIVYGNQNWYTQVRGVSPEYLAVRKWAVERGSSFFQDDVEHAPVSV